MRLIRYLVFALALVPVAPLFAAGPVDINTADAPTLASALNGIGLKKAAEIVAYREQHGPFESVDDLAKVKGVGQSIIEKNRANIEVHTPAPQAASKAKR